MSYTEAQVKTIQAKHNYAEGFEHIIAERQRQAEQIRKEYIKEVFENPEKYREDLKRMLGWPLVDYEVTGLPEASKELLFREEGYSIFRMEFEILEGLKMCGLFFEAEGEDKKPLVIVQHGGLGTPEFIAGFYGSTDNYNDMLRRVQKHGVHIFAPQLLLWSENYGVPFNRVETDARLKRVGSSVTAVEIFGIRRIMDYFEPHVKNFGMVGMSYGGFYAMYTSALDTRIKSSVSCSFFNSRDAVCRPDWAWQNSAMMFDDTEVVCLIYPRKIYIQMGKDDSIFDYNHTEESFRKVLELSGENHWAELKVFEGKHEFYNGDEYIEKLVHELYGE